MTTGDSPEHAKIGGWGGVGWGYMQRKLVHKPMTCCRMVFHNACVIAGDTFVAVAVPGAFVSYLYTKRNRLSISQWFLLPPSTYHLALLISGMKDEGC